MTQLTTRQTGLLIIINFIALKFITFPSMYAAYAGTDGYLAMLISLFLDLCAIAILLYVSKNNPNKTFNQIITERLGGITTRIINFFLFIIIFIKSIYLLKEYHNYLLDTLFTYFSFTFFLLPLFLLLGFIMSRSLRAVGRGVEILFYLVIVGLLIVFILPIKHVNILNVMPFFENGIAVLFKTSLFCSFATGDFLIFMLLLGKFKVEKNSHRNLFFYALVGAAIVFAFYFIYFTVFGNITINAIIAIGDLPLFVAMPSTVGRIDWVTINLWTITLLLQLSLLFSFALETFSSAFKIKNKTYGIVIIISAAGIFGFIIFKDLPILLKAIVSVPMVNFNLIGYLIPLMLLAITIYNSAKAKKHRKEKKNVWVDKKVFSK